MFHLLAMNATGGIVSAVCHGPAILPKILDPSGKPII